MIQALEYGQDIEASDSVLSDPTTCLLESNVCLFEVNEHSVQA